MIPLMRSGARFPCDSWHFVTILFHSITVVVARLTSNVADRLHKVSDHHLSVQQWLTV